MAAFVMQSLGCEVAAINTVNFSKVVLGLFEKR
jgi:pyridoxal/pyridoxine/pyridoxamine kinase